MLGILAIGIIMLITPHKTKICKAIQNDIPLQANPFRAIARQIGLPESDIISNIRDLIQSKVIRKFGALVAHQKAGYRNNALVIWAVPRNRCEEVGRILASFKEVTHCYERDPAFQEKYTIFSMVHFQTFIEESMLDRMKIKTGITDCKILQSEQELKKASMTYFHG